MQLSWRSNSRKGDLSLGMEGIEDILLCARCRLLRLESSLQNKCSGKEVSWLLLACNVVRSEQPLSHCGSDVSLLCDTSISTRLIGGTVVVRVSNSEKRSFDWIIILNATLYMV